MEQGCRTVSCSLSVSLSLPISVCVSLSLCYLSFSLSGHGSFYSLPWWLWWVAGLATSQLPTWPWARISIESSLSRTLSPSLFFSFLLCLFLILSLSLSFAHLCHGNLTSNRQISAPPQTGCYLDGINKSLIRCLPPKREATVDKHMAGNNVYVRVCYEAAYLQQPGERRAG